MLRQSTRSDIIASDVYVTPNFWEKLYVTAFYVTPQIVYVTFLMSPRGDIRKKGGDIKKKTYGGGDELAFWHSYYKEI